MQPNTPSVRKSEPEPEIKVIDVTNIQIPLCCKEGWKSCPHVLPKQKPTRRNIGL